MSYYNIYEFPIPIGTTGSTYTSLIGFSNYYADDNESYKTDPKVLFQYAVDTAQGPISSISETVTISGDPLYDGRIAISLEKVITGGYRPYKDENLTSPGALFDETVDNGYTVVTYQVQQLPLYNVMWNDSRVTDIIYCGMETNIPIFETDALAKNYIKYGTNIRDAINYYYEHTDESEDFEVDNVWTSGTWSDAGLSNRGTINYRQLRGKMMSDAHLAFYPIAGVDNGALKYGIEKSGTFEALQYSDDGGVIWHDTQTWPYAYFFRPHENEKGTFNFGLSFFSKIPIFEDQETAQKYINEDPSVSIEDAINWPQISGKYPPVNNTGSALPESIFGEVKLKGFFSQQYICDSNCLSAIADDLFDTSATGMWEDFKKGMEAWGASPIEAVMGLSFWPFSVSDFIGAGNYAPAQYIWFGGYGWATTGHGTCNQIIYANGHKDIGTVRIVPGFNSWRDFEPYTKLYVSIPYCGTYQLDLARYLGKDVKVRYYIDTRTNGCICCLIADGYLMDYFNGQMGVTMPITLTDYSAYMNAQMQVLLQGGGQAASSFGNAAGTIGSLAPLGNAGMLAGGAVQAGVSALSGAVIGAKTVYGLSQNNINNFNKTKGGSSSMLNCYLPQTVDFIFEIQESCEPANYDQMFGSPSMTAGIIGS